MAEQSAVLFLIPILTVAVTPSYAIVINSLPISDCADCTLNGDCLNEVSYNGPAPAAVSPAQVPNPFINPCALDDYNCIRHVLSENSDCDTNVWGYVSEEVRFNNFRYEAPFFNATYTDQYEIVRNFDNCYVSAFFFVPNRERLVMSLTCPNLETRAYKYLAQHFPLQEDRSYFFRTESQLPSISLTVDVGLSGDLNLCDTFVFAYSDGAPRLRITGASPTSINAVNYDYNNALSQLQIYIREDLQQKAAAYFQLWVNNVLCNFNEYCTSD